MSHATTSGEIQAQTSNQHQTQTQDGAQGTQGGGPTGDADVAGNAAGQGSTRGQGLSDGLLFPIVPQDKTGEVHNIFLGMSFLDLALIVLPSVASIMFATEVLQWDLSTPVLVFAAALALFLFGLVQYTAWYITPREFISRNWNHLKVRWRMPLVAEAAREIPGLADAHPGYGAVERGDGALVRAIYVPNINTSQDSEGAAVQRAFRQAVAINSHIERAEDGRGFPIQIQGSQFGYSPNELAGLDRAADDPDLTELERRFAETRRDHVVETLNEDGVMDRGFRVVVAVSESEAVDRDDLMGGVERAIRQLPFERLTDAQRVTQARLLAERLDAVKKYARAAGGSGVGVREIPLDEFLHLQRAHWLGEHPHDVPDGLAETVTGRLQDGENAAGPGAGVVRGDEPLSEAIDRMANSSGSNSDSETATTTDGPDTENGDDTDTDATTGEKPLHTRISGLLLEGTIGTAGSVVLGTVRTIRSIPSATARMIRHGVSIVRTLTTEEDRRRWLDAWNPAPVDEHKLHVELGHGREYCRSLYVTGWPPRLSPGTLDVIALAAGAELQFAAHIENTDYHGKRKELKKEKKSIQSSALFRELWGDADSADADAVGAEKNALRDHMRESDVETGEVSVAVTVRAESLDRVNSRVRSLKSSCRTAGITLTDAHKRQLPALKSTAPLAFDALEDETTIDTRFDMPADALGCLLSYSGGVRQDEGGVMYGFAKNDAGDGRTIKPLHINRWDLTAPHRWITGRSGSSKTSGENEQLIEEHIRFKKQKTVIADVSRGFDGTVGIRGDRASKIDVGRDVINPFSTSAIADEVAATVADSALDNKVDLIVQILMIYLSANGPPNPQELRSTAELAVTETFHRRGITSDPNTHDPEQREGLDDPDRPLVDGSDPILQETFDVFDDMLENPARYARDRERYKERIKGDAEDLAHHLRPFEQGNRYDWLNGHEAVDLDADTLFFDMARFEERGEVERAISQLLATSSAYEIAKTTPEQVVYALDEAHKSFFNEKQANRLIELVLAGRNYGLAFDFISQEVGHFLEGHAAGIVDQCNVAVMHELGDVDAKLAADALDLTEEQYQLLAGGLITGDNAAADSAEALVIVEGDAYVVEKKYAPLTLALTEYDAFEHDREYGGFEEFLAARIGEIKRDRAAEFDTDTEAVLSPESGSVDAGDLTADDLLATADGGTGQREIDENNAAGVGTVGGDSGPVADSESGDQS